MRYSRRLQLSVRWLPAVIPLAAALAAGCHGQVGETGGGGTSPTGGGGTTGGGGPDGGMPVNQTPCSGPADPRMAVADQRILLLTKPQIVNTIAYLIDQTEATALAASGMFSITADSDRHFPPADGEESALNTGNIAPYVNLGTHVSDYVTKNFAAVTKCQTATDSCATSYLTALARKAYRRDLTSDEQSRLTDLYNGLKTQIVNGYQVTSTVQEATAYSVWGLLISPQLTWRWEIGGGTPSTLPPGVYLTDNELASQLSFFMTDGPPDDMLLAAAKAGTLRANLASQVSRLLMSQPAKDWLRHVMEIYLFINQLPAAPVDSTKFPDFTEGLMASMVTESQMFLDNVLWGSNSKMKDLLTSQTTFVNDVLATKVYKIPVPAGATTDNFVQTTLPADQRAGIVTNAGFLTARSRSNGQDLVSRGKAIKAAFLCLITSPPTDSATMAAVNAAAMTLDQQTGQQQAMFRAGIAVCAQCHASFDSYGLPLEFFDAIGAYRTTYSYLPGTPAIDGTATLPSMVGGATIHNGVELAKAFADSQGFTNCLAKSMMQYSVTDPSAYVELPIPNTQPGCAVTDLVQRYQKGSSQTFTGLISAVTQSPAFVVRRVVQ